LRNNWKVPEHVYNSLVLLLNIQRAAIGDPGKACYLLNFAKNSQFSGECPGETGSYLTAHTTIQSSRTAETVVDRKGAVSAGILVANVPGLCRH
jgi:hypothetical protein